ncbi:monocarboxylate transporter 2-like [Haliotis rubra]|uniref:monocarboxylate transporter 2-like n=1 Tax=Haliotis rubra TaxID=36100 RepID=UPI001EE5A799|nr:monocarboxylate transporter 2-like [Haliotis rubra]
MCDIIPLTGVYKHCRVHSSEYTEVCSLVQGSYMHKCPVAGMVHQKLGSRKTAMISGVLVLIGMTSAYFCQKVLELLITYGLVTGLALGLASNVAGVVPGYYFLKRRPIAFGVSMAGSGAGLFTGPLARYLLDQYNLHGTLLILGGIGFNMCFAGALLRSVRDQEQTKSIVRKTEEEGCPQPHPEATSLMRQSEENNAIIRSVQSSDDGSPDPGYTGSCLYARFRIFIQMDFVLYNVSVFLWCLGASSCILHLPNYAEYKGSSPIQAATLLPAVGAGSIFSRIVVGLASSDTNIDDLLLQFGITGITGTLALVFPLLPNSYNAQLVFSCLYGTYCHGVYSLLGPMTIRLLGLPNASISYGIVSLFIGGGHLLGPPTASFLYKTSGIYEYTYIFSGLCSVLSSISVASTSAFRSRRLDN